MRTVPIRATERVERSVVESVAVAFATCYTLADLMRWCERQSPRVQVSDIIIQDEYTHDLVLPFGAAFLSFDTT